MRAMAPDWTIDSAGTGDWHVGESPYPPMIAAGRSRGYDLTPLRARQVAAADLARFDHVIAMDEDNLRNLKALAGPEIRANLCLLLDYAPGHGSTNVPDPYFTRDFAGALDLIEAGCKGLLAGIARR